MPNWFWLKLQDFFQCHVWSALKCGWSAFPFRIPRLISLVGKLHEVPFRKTPQFGRHYLVQDVQNPICSWHILLENAKRQQTALPALPFLGLKCFLHLKGHFGMHNCKQSNTKLTKLSLLFLSRSLSLSLSVGWTVWKREHLSPYKIEVNKQTTNTKNTMWCTPRQCPPVLNTCHRLVKG